MEDKYKTRTEKLIEELTAEPSPFEKMVLRELELEREHEGNYMNEIKLIKLAKQPVNKVSKDGNNYKVVTFKALINGQEEFLSFTMSPIKQNGVDLGRIMQEYLNVSIMVEDIDLAIREWVNAKGEQRRGFDLHRPVYNLKKLDRTLFPTQAERLIREW